MNNWIPLIKYKKVIFKGEYIDRKVKTYLTKEKFLKEYSKTDWDRIKKHISKTEYKDTYKHSNGKTYTRTITYKSVKGHLWKYEEL